jgi:hypothetical protein
MQHDRARGVDGAPIANARSTSLIPEKPTLGVQQHEAKQKERPLTKRSRKVDPGDMQAEVCPRGCFTIVTKFGGDGKFL